MPYVVCHARKVTTSAGLAAVISHNDRRAVWDEKGRPKGELPTWISHPERAGLNQVERLPEGAILARRQARIREANLSRKPQRNAAAAVEFVVSASPEWFAGRSPAEVQRYFADAREFLARRYGAANLLHVAIHHDEETPHIHVVMVPIVDGAKGLKYSSGAFLGGPGGLRDLQTQIGASVGRLHGLERGEDGSAARHTNQHEWQRDLERRESTAAERERVLGAREKELDAREHSLGAYADELQAWARGEHEKAWTEAENWINGLAARKGLAVAQAVSDDLRRHAPEVAAARDRIKAPKRGGMER